MHPATTPTLVSAIATIAAIALGGCVDQELCQRGSWPAPEPTRGDADAPAEDPEQSVAPTERVAEILPTDHRAIDLLFVVDDSNSMADEQEQLGVWSDELFSVLAPTGELPDLHVAVLSSSLPVPGILGCEPDGSAGVFHTGSAELGGDRFLRDIAVGGKRSRNYEGSLGETFAAMARVGRSGCGFEQPFEATRRALSGGIPENAGFLRDDALLVIVFVSDEDDCSIADDAMLTTDRPGGSCTPLGPLNSFRCFEFGVFCDDGRGARERGPRFDCRPDEDSPYIAPVAPFARFLKHLKPHPGQIVVAGVYGKPHSVTIIDDPRWEFRGAPSLDKVCESAHGTATPGIRINHLLSHFPARAAQSSICDPTLAWAMRNTALVTHRVATRSPCLTRAVADTDVDADGIQPRCTVESSIVGRATGPRVPIRPCAEVAEGERCFTIEADAERCDETDSQLAVRLHGSGTPGETISVSCEVPAF